MILVLSLGAFLGPASCSPGRSAKGARTLSCSRPDDVRRSLPDATRPAGCLVPDPYREGLPCRSGVDRRETPSRICTAGSTHGSERVHSLRGRQVAVLKPFELAELVAR